jgi:hypothetical protein
MTEQLLQYLWKYRLLDTQALCTLEGEPVQVIKPGEQNRDSGADFSNARLKIGETVWAGNVEIELESANWEKHGHHTDASHSNTLLLVCLRHTAKNPVSVPVIELGKRVNEKYSNTYRQLMESQAFIPCHSFFARADSFAVQSWLQRLLVERMEEKIAPILTSLYQNKNNWEETFYHALAKNFGFNTNSIPFELLAKSIPLKILAKHKNSLLQIEALLLGQSGLLQIETTTDSYTERLMTEYAFLANKYKLLPINPSLWKFSKTRPVNFPTLRIAQFAALTHTSSHLFSKILETETVQHLQPLFEIKASAYWDTHYRLGQQTTSTHNILGIDAINNILINTIAPFLFAYGHSLSNEEYKQKALALLEQLPKENNHIIRSYQNLSLKINSAAETQALLQLYKHWCTPKKCLQCRIGHKILCS